MRTSVEDCLNKAIGDRVFVEQQSFPKAVRIHPDMLEMLKFEVDLRAMRTNVQAESVKVDRFYSQAGVVQLIVDDSIEDGTFVLVDDTQER